MAAGAAAGGGYAALQVWLTPERTRTLYFRFGRPVGADTSRADGYPPFSARREGDLYLVSVGSERYEVADRVIFGN